MQCPKINYERLLENILLRTIKKIQDSLAHCKENIKKLGVVEDFCTVLHVFGTYNRGKLVKRKKLKHLSLNSGQICPA